MRCLKHANVLQKEKGRHETGRRKIGTIQCSNALLNSCKTHREDRVRNDVEKRQVKHEIVDGIVMFC